MVGKNLTVNANEPQIIEEKQVATCCHMCGGGTGVIATVRNGVVAGLEPNVHNPIGVCNVADSYENNSQYGGAMCPKGLSGIMALYDPDRITKPLMRTNPEKGIGVDPKWREISWDEALSEITTELRKLLEDERPEALITVSENSLVTDIQKDFCKLFGTPNAGFHTNICSATRKGAAKAVLGVDEPLGDYQNSKYMLLFGWNPLSAVKWSHLPQIILNGKQNGAKLVVIDPRYSETAAKADVWHPITPGTDGALALAMAHVIINAKIYDEEFINNWTTGFSEYQKYVQDKTPEWAEKICGVSANDIRKLAIDFASNQPAIADAWIGPGQQSNGFNAIRAVFLLNVLVGSVDKKGGMLLTKELQLGPSMINKSSSNIKRYDQLEKYPFGHKSGVYVETFRQLAQQNGPYPVDAAIITMSNPVLSVPNTLQVIEGLKRLKFITVIDNYLSETALMADIVLPGTTYLERFGLVTRGIHWQYVALRQPVKQPLYGQLSESDIFIELAKRLHLRDDNGNLPFEEIGYLQYLDYRLRGSIANISLEELQELPGAVWRSEQETPYRQYVTEPIQTESGKFQFVLDKEKYAEMPHILLPEYHRRIWEPDDKYPFYLLSWKHVTHTHSRTQNNPYLSELKDYNHLYINPDTGKSMGFEDGDEVRVTSPYGSLRANLKFSASMHPKVVGTDWGFGHWGFGDYAKGKGFAVNKLNDFIVDQVTGQAAHKEICVKIERF
ncbi:hypothetical protein BHU72_07340 [Desulfuribacillus stibiiarsenatis]|uniref:4Fe-4S Mo/W bis-MGD-type domain-containing protein n=1 Tax=Desulfuribacillus stibiiarsenatis TaxID=1390249 RepID=A0A1E5L4F6_9FIRM|nr:hypothetical protein BHU72_07340 [Desulfuribacillus stibiiarsenatis]